MSAVNRVKRRWFGVLFAWNTDTGAATHNARRPGVIANVRVQHSGDCMSGVGTAVERAERSYAMGRNGTGLQ